MTGDEPSAAEGTRPPPLPKAGPPPLVLEYGHDHRAGRLTFLSRTLSPAQSALAFGGLTFLFAIGTGRTPALVAVAAGLLGGALVFIYARARRQSHEPSLLTRQLLLAGGVAMTGVIATIDRARLVSNSIMWLPDNQTRPFRPAWALQPLWLTAFGLAWFLFVMLHIEWRDRRRLSDPPQPE